ncbi:hypothetical protein [Streptomyces arenae]|uniref:acyl-CoA-like ligand-binding transcription factor n=1 Tax=Streptomyces arenae TaxID=29301 RepID=UPI003D274F48
MDHGELGPTRCAGSLDDEGRLVAAVRGRPAGRSVLDALREHVLTTWLPIAAHPQTAKFTQLVNTTPALRAYAERMWTRHADTLAAAIADEYGADHDNVACAALARFVLEIPGVAQRQKDRGAAVEEVFDIITNGWQFPDGHHEPTGTGA